MNNKNSNTTIVVLTVALVIVVLALVGAIVWGLASHMGKLTDVFHSGTDKTETEAVSGSVEPDVISGTVEEVITEEAPADVADALKFLSVTIGGQEAAGNMPELTLQEARDLIRAAADQADNGNASLYAYLTGLMYWQGYGDGPAENDRKLACGYFKQAAEGGLSDAMLVYARVYFLGELEPAQRNVRDEAKEPGNAYLGYQVFQNFEEARRYYTALLAADDSFGVSDEVKAESSYALGCMFLYGMCVDQDGKVAAKYFEQAAEYGYGGTEAALDLAGKTDGDGEKEEIVGGEAKYAVISFPGEEMQQVYASVKSALEKGDNTSAELNAELTELLQAPTEPAGNETLYGLHDWLFYQSVTDGKSVRDYLREDYMSDSEKKAILDNLNANAALVREKDPDAKLAIVIIPNKEIVYSEYMPAYLQVANEKTRAEDLIAYLEENGCEAELIYTKEDMLKYKADQQLYYRTDTHCNMKGAYVTLSAIMRLFGKELDLNTAVFNSNQELYAGDLASEGKLKRTARYQTDFVYNLLPGEIPDEQKLDQGSVLIIGDSFSTFLDMMGIHFFRDDTSRFMCPMVNAYDYSYNLAMEYLYPNRDVDYVVWECAERHLTRLKGTP